MPSLEDTYLKKLLSGKEIRGIFSKFQAHLDQKKDFLENFLGIRVVVENPANSPEIPSEILLKLWRIENITYDLLKDKRRNINKCNEF